jgi:hypothetical protein
VSALREVIRKLRATRSRRPTGHAPEADPYATAQAYDVGTVTMDYNPDTDGDPDPGEIIWTWVPYEENDGRGKDRPALVVAREPQGTVLGVQLSSQDHDDDPDWVAVGTGGWDGDHRPSWVDTSRVLRIHERGMRREAAALPRDRFDDVAAALIQRYGWRLR